MKLSYEPLRQIGSKKEVPVPKQNIRLVLRGIVYFLGQRYIKTDYKSFSVHETTYFSPTAYSSPLKETFKTASSYLRVRHYKPKERSNSAVIVLPQRGEGYNYAQLVAEYLASHGMSAYEVEMPFRGSRLPRGFKEIDKLPITVYDLKPLAHQVTAEVRGLVEIIEEEYGKIGICGISLSAIYSSIIYGIEDRLSSACLVLGGGRLEELILKSKDRFAKRIRSDLIKNDISEEQLKGTLKDIEPCNNTAPEKSRSLLMINAESDESIPGVNGDSLRVAWGNPKVYRVKANHRNIIGHIPELLSKILEHYRNTLV